MLGDLLAWGLLLNIRWQIPSLSSCGERKLGCYLLRTLILLFDPDPETPKSPLCMVRIDFPQGPPHPISPHPAAMSGQLTSGLVLRSISGMQHRKPWVAETQVSAVTPPPHLSQIHPVSLLCEAGELGSLISITVITNDSSPT